MYDNNQPNDASKHEVVLIPPKPYGLIADFTAVTYHNDVCMYPGCFEPPIGSHVLSRSWIQRYANNQIVQLQTITHDPFDLIKDSVKKKYYKPCNLNKISIFNGFCFKHDHEIFQELDNYNGYVTPMIALLNHYRIICFGLNEIYLQKKQHEFLKGAVFVGTSTKVTKEIQRKIKNGFFLRGLQMAEVEYIERKRVCEEMIINKDPKIVYVPLQGDMSNPLFFGRAGRFLHLFGRNKLPIRFMSQMPYIMYSSITDGKACNLVFTYLPQDIEKYGNDLDAFISHADFKKRLEILIYSQSDCCIIRKDIPISSSHIVQKIVSL